MLLEQIRAEGGDRNFSYVIADPETGEAAVIDAGAPPSQELDLLNRGKLTLRYIISTHDHFDHTGGNDALAKHTGAVIAMHERSRTVHDLALRDGMVLKLGGLELRIIHTPGHTHDSVCILAGENLFTGDTLFVGKVGGTGFGHDALEEYESLHQKLMVLPPATRIWPGHNYGTRSWSTIGDELRENPFILCDSFEAFLDLKMNWAEYKRIHGIA